MKFNDGRVLVVSCFFVPVAVACAAAAMLLKSPPHHSAGALGCTAPIGSLLSIPLISVFLIASVAMGWAIKVIASGIFLYSGGLINFSTWRAVLIAVFLVAFGTSAITFVRYHPHATAGGGCL